MDFWQTLSVLLKRWYVAVPVLLVTIVVAGATFFTVPTQYESSGSAVLIMPPAGPSVSNDPTKPVGTVNPLLAFDGSLEVAAKLEIATLSDPAVLDRLAAQGGTAEIEAGDGGLNGPFILVIATSSSAAEAQRTVQLAFAHVQDELTTRQDKLGAPRSTYINVEPVVSPTPGEPKLGGKVRAAGVALALGLIMSLWSAFVIEGIMQRRRGGPGVLAPPAGAPPVVLPPANGRFGEHAPPPAGLPRIPVTAGPAVPGHSQGARAPVGHMPFATSPPTVPHRAQPPSGRPPVRRRPTPRAMVTAETPPLDGGAPDGQRVRTANVTNGTATNGKAGPGPHDGSAPPAAPDTDSSSN